MSKILVFAGSTRKESLNKRLARAAADRARTLGATVTLIDLGDYSMPIYDGDLEDSEGLPDTVVRLKTIMKEHDGWLIACPEYNSSITAVLKNTIDWCSRPAEGEAMLAAFSGKVVGLLAASPGALGGMRGLVHVRSILSSIGMIVIPKDAAVGQAHKALGPDGSIADAGAEKRVTGVVSQLVETTTKLLG